MTLMILMTPTTLMTLMTHDSNDSRDSHASHDSDDSDDSDDSNNSVDDDDDGTLVRVSKPRQGMRRIVDSDEDGDSEPAHNPQKPKSCQARKGEESFCIRSRGRLILSRRRLQLSMKGPPGEAVGDDDRAKRP
jgi:hypothetical protein